MQSPHPLSERTSSLIWASTVGLALAMTITPAEAREKVSGPPAGRRIAAPPWAGPGRTTPPLPGPAENQAAAGGDRSVPVADAPSRSVVRGGHSAIHGESTAEATGPLFPRAPRSSSSDVEASGSAVTDAAGTAPAPSGEPSAPPPPIAPAPRLEPIVMRSRSRQEQSMTRHPAAQCGETYVVQPDDTLWDIAAEVLGTNDIRRIARYWPSIHKANRAAIGNDPHFITPGAILALPAEC